MIKVLSVDDEKDIADSFVMILNMTKGLESVGAAYNSDEAVKLVQEHKPLLLLLDYNLNDKLLGTDIFEIAKKANPNAMGILITGNRDATVEEACEKVGIKKIIEKPVVLKEFKQMLEEEVIPKLSGV